MKTFRWFTTALPLLICSLVNASTNSAELKGKLILTGSSTLAPLVAEMAKKFEKKYKNVRIDVQTGGSSRGVVDTLQGVADIGMISRSLKPNENKLLPFTIAKDGISIILHRSNPVKRLTKEEIIKIFTGKITNWKQIGGKDQIITVVHKAAGRSTLELFLKHFSLKNYQVKPHVIIGDNEQGIKTVSGNPGSIGYVSIGTAEYSAKNNINIQLLPINGITASIQSVSNGQFPLSRPLNLITKTPPTGLSKAFIDFSQSKEVHELIKNQYFVPIKR